uniref:Uncharacterized protein n=1 Tax=Arion vulgaris TaxID=1028688 RepID=A0A0B7BI85_9EUPU
MINSIFMSTLCYQSQTRTMSKAQSQKADAVTYQLTPLRHPNISLTAKQQHINNIIMPTLCYQSQP